MRLEIVGTANTAQAQAGVEALTAQVEILNKAMARTTQLGLGATPKQFAATTNALKASNATYANALATTGRFHTQTVKINDAIETQTKLLGKQSLAYNEVFGRKNKAMMDSIYNRQLALQHSYSTMVNSMTGDGSMRAMLSIPAEVSRSWDTTAKRIGFFGERLRSAGNEITKVGKNAQWAGRQLTVGLTMPIVAFGAAAGIMAYQADKQFTRIRKVYDTTADQFSKDNNQMMAAQKELDQVREDGMKTAVDAAREYGTSVQDTLSVQADLAATGQKGMALQKATTEVVKNAMLGEIDYQTTTKATIALQQQMHLSSKQLADTWAYMNVVENQTSLTMKDFATAIPIALGPIREMGGDVQTLGTLLTGLVSRGVQVGKAANAIKATAQRLIRPSQQVQEEFKAITGEDIVKIGKQNKGNLLGMLKDIYEVTKNLSEYNRTKVFAGLFGSFQLSTMHAMVESMGDLAEARGQVTKADEIGKQSAEEWGQVQRQEINAFQQSLSGKFQRTLATVKAELAVMGVPFLEAANVMLDVVAKLLHAFNSLPDGAKNVAMMAALLIAAVGPLRMLFGLTLNLVGTLGDAAGALLMFVTRWKSVTIAQKTAADAAELNAKHMLTEAEASEVLAKNLEAVTYALQQQAIATAQASRGAVVLPANMLPMMNEEQRMAYFRSQTPHQSSGAFPTSAMRDQYAAEQMALYKSNAGQAATATANAEKSSKRLGMNMKGAAVGGGLFAASMAASMISSNHVVDDLAQMGMLLSFAAPYITNPWVAAAAGVAVVGIGVSKLLMHEKAISDEKNAQNLALYKQNDALNEALRIDSKRLAMSTPSIFDPSRHGSNVPTVESTQQALESSDTGKQLVGAYTNASSEADKLTVATKLYYDVLNSSHGTVHKAQLALTALFRAAGDDAIEADDKVKKLYADLGNTETIKGATKLFGGLFSKAFEADTDNAVEQARGLGETIMTAMRQSIIDHKGEAGMALFDSVQEEIDKVEKRTKNRIENTTPGAVSANRYGAGMVGYAQTAEDRKVLAMQKAIVDYYKQQLGIQKDITTLKELQATYEFRLAFVTPKTAKGLMDQRAITETIGNNVLHIFDGQTKSSNEIRKQVREQINQSLKQNGYNYQIGETNDKLRQVSSTMANIPDSKNISVNIQTKQLGGIFQNAFTGVQQDMATRASSLLDAQAQAAMDRAQAAGQARIDAAQAAGQRRQDALERRQQAAQDAFDKHWQHREDMVNKYYDKLEAKIDKEIAAEERAEAKRQRIFDAEQARLDQLTDAANRNIDFNVALQTGQLDEAARIQNDMTNSATQFALGQGQQAEEDKSQRRIDRLNKQKDRLEKERQARLKALQKQEDDAKRHLERMQQMESAALQRSIDAHNKALQTQVDNQNAALQKEWDQRKANLDAQLALFTSYIASSKGDLQKWMKDVGLSYKDFGINTLQPMSDTWGGYFQKSFMQHLRQAGAEVASDNMWQNLGTSTMKKMLAGMGFPSMAGFKHFITSGNLPDDFGKKPPKVHHGNTTSTPHHGGIQDGGYHTGGRFGIDPGGREGRTGGLRSDEGFGLLKRGEMIMNLAATQKYLPALKQMNAEGLGIGGAQSPVSPAMSGLDAAVTAKLFMAGFGTALARIVEDARKSAKSGKTSGGFIQGPGGRHRPVPAGIGLTQGLHDTGTGYPAIDFAAPLNTPAYAVADGTITRSEAITSGGSPGNGLYSIPYRSYGNVEYLKVDGGPTVLYAHLNKRLASAGKRVKGGALIGRTGNTGNSTGPHLHFGSSDGNPMEWMRTGGHIMRDGMFTGHGGETVLTRPLSMDLKKAVSAFGEIASDRKLRHNLANLKDRERGFGAALGASQEVAGGDTYTYNVPISVLEPGASPDEIADTVVRKLKHQEGRLPTKRTNRG